MEKPVRPIFGYVLVAFVLGALGFLLVVRAAGSSGSQINPTRAAMKALEIQIDLFKVDHGRYPVRLDDLLRRPDYADAKKWPEGGYLPEAPTDAWGRPINYWTEDEGGAYVLVSWGRDGKPGGDGPDADLRIHRPR